MPGRQTGILLRAVILLCALLPSHRPGSAQTADSETISKVATNETEIQNLKDKLKEIQGAIERIETQLSIQRDYQATLQGGLGLAKWILGALVAAGVIREIIASARAGRRPDRPAEEDYREEQTA